MAKLDVIVDSSLKVWLKRRAREGDRTLSKYVASVLAEHRRATESGAPSAAQPATKGD